MLPPSEANFSYNKTILLCAFFFMSVCFRILFIRELAFGSFSTSKVEIVMIMLQTAI